MKTYVLLAACLMSLIGCQKRESGYSGGQSTSPSYSSAQTNSQTTKNQPPTGTMAQNPNNRTDQSAAGTPGRPTTETGSQRATQPGNDQLGAGDQGLTQSVRTSLLGGVGDVPAQTLKNIQITAMNGKVTLRGAVSSEQEKQQIEKQVKQLPGVQSIDNQLKVGQSDQPIESTKESELKNQSQTPGNDQKVQ